LRMRCTDRKLVPTAVQHRSRPMNGFSRLRSSRYFSVRAPGWQSVAERAVNQLLDQLAVIGADRAGRLAHVDCGELLLGVDPEIGSGIPGPHELARRARHAGDPAAGPNRKAEPERVAWGAEQEFARTKRRGDTAAEMIGGFYRDEQSGRIA
jgi:hypothetical protein